MTREPRSDETPRRELPRIVERIHVGLGELLWRSTGSPPSDKWAVHIVSELKAAGVFGAPSAQAFEHFFETWEELQRHKTMDRAAAADLLQAGLELLDGLNALIVAYALRETRQFARRQGLHIPSPQVSREGSPSTMDIKAPVDEALLVSYLQFIARGERMASGWFGAWAKHSGSKFPFLSDLAVSELDNAKKFEGYLKKLDGSHSDAEVALGEQYLSAFNSDAVSDYEKFGLLDFVGISRFIQSVEMILAKYQVDDEIRDALAEYVSYEQKTVKKLLAAFQQERLARLKSLAA